MDLVAVDHELGAQDVHPVLVAVPIAVRLVLEVMDAVVSQDRDVPRAGVGKMHDAGRIDRADVSDQSNPLSRRFHCV